MGKLLVLGWMALAACGSKPDAYEQVLVEMQALEARICGCADPACRAAAFDDLLAFRTSLGPRLEGSPKPSPAQTRRGRAIDDAIRACRRAGGDDAEPTGDEPAVPPTAPAR